MPDTACHRHATLRPAYPQTHLHIVQKNGAANHPTTQGKIERFHQTLKRWLAARPTPAGTLEELQALLEQFQHVYNAERPHRANARRTPDQTYATTPKATPTLQIDRHIWRIRYDNVDNTGKVTLRHQGKLRHLAIGRARTGWRIILLVRGNKTMVLARGSGEIIAEHLIDPDKTYQPRLPER